MSIGWSGGKVVKQSQSVLDVAAVPRIGVLGLVNGAQTDMVLADAGAGQTVFGAMVIFSDAIVEAGEAFIGPSANRYFLPLSTSRVFSVESEFTSVFICGVGTATGTDCVLYSETTEPTIRAQLTQFEFIADDITLLDVNVGAGFSSDRYAQIFVKGLKNA